MRMNVPNAHKRQALFPGDNVRSRTFLGGRSVNSRLEQIRSFAGFNRQRSLEAWTESSARDLERPDWRM